jgi:hypothetical protein
MPAFFSPSKQYRYADAIAASFFESRQTAEPRDLLVGDGVAAVVTIVDVTKRRILVVDVGAKNSAAEVNKRATEARIAATPPLVMSMNVRETQKFKHSFLRKLGSDMHGSTASARRHCVDRPALQLPGALPQG